MVNLSSMYSTVFNVRSVPSLHSVKTVFKLLLAYVFCLLVTEMGVRTFLHNTSLGDSFNLLNAVAEFFRH